MDTSLHDLVENYTGITPKLRGNTRHRRRAKWAAALLVENYTKMCGKTRHRQRAKLAAALRAAANSVRQECRVFASGCVDLRVNF